LNFKHFNLAILRLQHDLGDLDLSTAQVKRIDIAADIISKHKPSLYGECFVRHKSMNAIFYKVSDTSFLAANSNRAVKVYSKLDESLFESIHTMGLNLLRIEFSYQKKLKISLETLLTKEGYKMFMDKVKTDFERIVLVDNKAVEFNECINIKEFKKTIIKDWVHLIGGANQAQRIIRTNQKLKNFSNPKGYSVLKKMIDELGSTQQHKNSLSNEIKTEFIKTSKNY